MFAVVRICKNYAVMWPYTADATKKFAVRELWQLPYNNNYRLNGSFKHMCRIPSIKNSKKRNTLTSITLVCNIYLILVIKIINWSRTSHSTLQKEKLGKLTRRLFVEIWYSNIYRCINRNRCNVLLLICRLCNYIQECLLTSIAFLPA